MMVSSELIILDVGHGNCSIIRHGAEAIIIDAPARPIMTSVLDDLGITSIHALLVSHADSDHLSGVTPLLLDPKRPVKDVYVNPDNRRSSAWLQFRIAAGEARRDRGTLIHSSLNLQDPGEISLLGTKLQIVFPTPEMCLATNEGKHIDGTRNDANSMSAVVLVEHLGEPICLLAADSGFHSLEVMIKEKLNLKAPMLIFPHHGGHVSGTTNNKEFAKRLVAAVEPQVVIFSLGRGSHGTPRPEIVAGVREGFGGVFPYVACTQLSKNCAVNLPSSARVLNKNSDGIVKNSCCAGTVSWPLQKDGLQVLTNDLKKHHFSFVENDVPHALCKRVAPIFPVKVTVI